MRGPIASNGRLAGRLYSRCHPAAVAQLAIHLKKQSSVCRGQRPNGRLKARFEAGNRGVGGAPWMAALSIDCRRAMLHERWSRAFNLTGTQDRETLVEGHLLDCAAVLPALTEPGVLYDVGTGAGLPGLILAALAPERPFVLVESLGKRVRFLEKAIDTPALPQVTILEQRAEQAAFAPGAAGILARAVALLERLCASAGPWKRVAGSWL